MRTKITTRLTSVWVILSACTIVSWWLGSMVRDRGKVVSSVPITIVVLAIGCVKARLVIRQFMEVRTAPKWLRLFTDIWLIAFWGAVLAIYLS